MGKKDRVKLVTRKHSKRKFCGNQFTKNAAQRQAREVEESENAALSSSKENQPLSAPQKKIPSAKSFERIETNTPKSTDKSIDGYRIVDMELLSDLISSSLSCPDCYADGLVLKEDFQRSRDSLLSCT